MDTGIARGNFRHPSSRPMSSWAIPAVSFHYAVSFTLMAWLAGTRGAWGDPPGLCAGRSGPRDLNGDPCTRRSSAASAATGIFSGSAGPQMV